MYKEDLLLKDFKNSTLEIENINSIRGGQKKIIPDGTNTGCTDGDKDCCDVDDQQGFDTTLNGVRVFIKKP